MHIALAAGEKSGDLLGASLCQALIQKNPKINLSGISGDAMNHAGCKTLHHVDSLSVMGLWEVLNHLPRLLKLRQTFIEELLAMNPDIFVGIDAPDFNLPIENKIKARGIPTVHYVSPSVWAWREKRALKIKSSTDRVLCLFPFEPDIYAKYDVQADFIGHPFAESIPLKPKHSEHKIHLGLSQYQRLVAILPGSRTSELARLSPVFIEAAKILLQRQPELHFITPLANSAQYQLFKTYLQEADMLPHFTLFLDQARSVMQAADIGLIASGTAALEAMLCKLPMIVSYKISPITYKTIHWFKMMQTDFYALPNVLHQGELVPEIMQDNATPENLAHQLEQLLDDTAHQTYLKQVFLQLHQKLLKNSSEMAAEAIFQTLQS